jgi:hypothetical protein
MKLIKWFLVNLSYHHELLQSTASSDVCSVWSLLQAVRAGEQRAFPQIVLANATTVYFPFLLILSMMSSQLNVKYIMQIMQCH